MIHWIYVMSTGNKIVCEIREINRHTIDKINILLQKKLQQLQPMAQQNDSDHEENVLFEEDSLEKNLIKTRYSVIDQMFIIRESLEKYQKDKIENLQKKILQLENADALNNRLAMKYQIQLDKLEKTQNMAFALLGIKVSSEKTVEEHVATRRQVCSELRTSLQRNKKKSMDFYQKLKQKRVEKIKQENSLLSLKKKKLSENDIESRRNRSNQVRQSQFLGRQRLRRYEQFRLAQAKFNYDEKKEKLWQKHVQKLQLLSNLRKKVDNSEEVFRRTQILSQQVNQIQSLYIT